MTALTTISQTSLPAIMKAEMQAAINFALAEKSPATRRAYQSDFKQFEAYCARRDLTPVPATTSTAAAYLAYLATQGLRPSSIQRAAAAIRYAHRLAGHEAPTNAETVKATMRGIRRTVGAAKAPKTAATSDCVRDMLAACPDTLRGKRDRALLALGFAGAFRRSELEALTVADLVEKADGYEVVIRTSKTDQTGEGQTIAIPQGSRMKPVEAVMAWLKAAGITAGPIFRPINKGGKVAEQAMTGESIAAVVKQYAKLCGYDPAHYAGHSLRAGFLTSAAEAGSSVFKMMEVSRHKSIDTLRHYVRRADLFKDHAGASFL
ncbi:MAG TPA: site-specific integrase [Acidocella sp.]|nr:MAG: hypothetical protein B7Z77_08510 [Acidocella sp. 20-58-15]HQT39641.1 site-specific integrase [Acidocella sp.]